MAPGKMGVAKCWHPGTTCVCRRPAGFVSFANTAPFRFGRIALTAIIPQGSSADRPKPRAVCLVMGMSVGVRRTRGAGQES